MNKVQSQHACFALCVPQLLVLVSLGSCLGMRPEEERGYHGNMAIIFGNFLLKFPDSHLRGFLDCLCSSSSSNCTIYYKPGRPQVLHSKYHFTVLSTSSDARKSSHLVNDDVFECEKPSFLNKMQNVSCIRRKIGTPECNSFGHSGMFRWAIHTDSCSRCRNICWLHRNVSFVRNSNRSFPEKGLCVSTIPVPPTPKQRERVEKSSRSVTLPSVWRGRTGENFPLVQTTTNVSVAITSTSPETNISESKTTHVSDKNEHTFYLIIYSILGCILAVIVLVSSVSVAYRWHKKRNELNVDGSKSSHTNFHPHAKSTAMDIGRRHEASTLPIRTREVGNLISSSDSDNTYSLATGDAHDIMVSNISNSLKRVGQRHNEPSNPHSFKPRHTLDTQRYSHSTNTEVVLGQRSRKRSSLQLDRSLSIPAKTTQNIPKPYGSLPRRALMPKSIGGQDKAENCAVYSRLQTERRWPQDETECVSDTYNKAAGDVASPQAKTTAWSKGQGQVRNINIIATPISNNRIGLNATQVRVESPKDNFCETNHSELDNFEPAASEYFTLEEVDQSRTQEENISTWSSTNSSIEQHEWFTSKTVGNSENCEVDSYSGDATELAIGAEYFVLEDSAGVCVNDAHSDEENGLNSLPLWNYEWSNGSDLDNSHVYQEIHYDLERVEYTELDDIRT